MRLEILDRPGDVARAAAAWLAGELLRAVRERGRFVVGVSGGATPGPALRELAADPGLPWPRVTIVQVDERIAPDGSDARNLTDHRIALAPALARRARLVALVAGGDEPDNERLGRSRARLERAAGRPPTLDVVQLGLGADGHTASLVPDDLVLQETSRDLAITEPYRGHRRITMTAPILSRARRRLWVVVGEDKSRAVAQLLSGDDGVPAGLVNRRATIVMVDEAAAPRVS